MCSQALLLGNLTQDEAKVKEELLNLEIQNLNAQKNFQSSQCHLKLE
jgi:hypothetical protein